MLPKWCMVDNDTPTDDRRCATRSHRNPAAPILARDRAKILHPLAASREKPRLNRARYRRHPDRPRRHRSPARISSMVAVTRAGMGRQPRHGGPAPVAEEFLTSGADADADMTTCITDALRPRPAPLAASRGRRRRRAGDDQRRQDHNLQGNDHLSSRRNSLLHRIGAAAPRCRSTTRAAHQRVPLQDQQHRRPRTGWPIRCAHPGGSGTASNPRSPSAQRAGRPDDQTLGRERCGRSATRTAAHGRRRAGWSRSAAPAASPSPQWRSCPVRPRPPGTAHTSGNWPARVASNRPVPKPARCGTRAASVNPSCIEARMRAWPPTRRW